MKYLYCEPFAQTVPSGSNLSHCPVASGTNAGALLSLPKLHLSSLFALSQSGGLGVGLMNLLRVLGAPSAERL
jgi:hypothetical protein